MSNPPLPNSSSINNSGVSNLNMPTTELPFVSPDGKINRAWWMFLQNLFIRVGGQNALDNSYIMQALNSRGSAFISSDDPSSDDPMVIPGPPGARGLPGAVGFGFDGLDGEDGLMGPPGPAGQANLVQNAKTASYTCLLSDAGSMIYFSGSTAAQTLTIPANATAGFSIGTAITFVNMATVSVSVALTTDTLTWSPTGGTGTRTLAQFGLATAIKITATQWLISGTGLT